MKYRLPLAVLMLLSLFAATLSLSAQQSTAGSSAPSPSASQLDPQAISKTGLLPIYGVALRLDPSWVDGSQFPSQSSGFANSGVTTDLQQTWTALQPGGLNVLRFPIDVRDAAGAANRAANLSVWSGSNNVRLILLLAGSDEGQSLGEDYPRQVAAFVKTLVALLRGSNGQQLSSYSQIAAYQLEDELNHPGRHGAMAVAAAQQLLLKAAQNLRAAERQALDGSGLDATPLMVSASFDFELIRARMIAGATMNDDSYANAYKGLTQFLSPLAASPDIDLMAVDWLPGSVSAGSIDKFPGLLRSLLSDLRNKQLILSTGFSTAFNGREDQKHFYALAFATLSDFRASIGLDCPFVGILFREAFNGRDQNPTPPRASLPAETASWDWPAKADELNKMWTDNKPSDDVAWWLKKTENNLGLLAAPGVAATDSAAATPVQETLTQIASAVSSASNANPNSIAGTPTQPADNPDAGSASPVPPTGQAFQGTVTNSVDPAVSTFSPQQPTPSQPGSGGGVSASTGQTGGLANTLQSNAQQGLLSVLDAAFQRLGNVVSGGSGRHDFNRSDCGNSLPAGKSGSSGALAPALPCGTTTAFGSQPGDASVSANSASSFTFPASPASDNQLAPNNTSFVNPANSNFTTPTAANTASPENPASSSLSAANSTALGSPTSSSPPSESALNAVSPGSLAPPLIRLSAQNVSLRPYTPQVNDSVTLAITLVNQGQSEASGVLVFALADDNSALARSDSLRVAPAVPVTTTLSKWIPTEAKMYRMTILVVDGFGNQQAALPLRVDVSPRAVDYAQPVAANGAAMVGTGGSAAASQLANPIVTAPAGAVSFSGMQAGSFTQGIVAGQPAPVTVSLSNPFLVPMSNVQATLVVDGNRSSAQTLTVLLPGQTRSVLFPAVTITSPGRHQMGVVLESQRPVAKPQTTTVMGQIDVRDAQHASPATSVRSIMRLNAATQPSTPSSGSAPVSIPTQGVPTKSGQASGSVRSILALALAKGQVSTPAVPALSVVSSNTPPSRLGQVSSPAGPAPSVVSSNTTPPRQGQVSSPALPAPSVVSSNTTPSRLGSAGVPLPPPAPKVRPHPDLVIRAEDIGYEPALPAAGQRVSFIALVRNVGNGIASRVTLNFTLLADGKPVARSQPFQFDLQPGSARRQNFQAAMPPARQVQLEVFVSENDGGNLINKQATIGIQAAPPRKQGP